MVLPLCHASCAVAQPPLIFFVDGQRVSLLFVAGSDDKEDSATAPAAGNSLPTPTDTGASVDAEGEPREVWSKCKALFLISKYKELNTLLSKKGGFRCVQSAITLCVRCM